MTAGRSGERRRASEAGLAVEREVRLLPRLPHVGQHPPQLRPGRHAQRQQVRTANREFTRPPTRRHRQQLVRHGVADVARRLPEPHQVG